MEMIYIYRAALHCADCGERIRAALTAEGRAPADPENESTYDSDRFPKSESRDFSGERDTPEHCDTCGAYLRLPLTPDGVRYAVDALAEFVRSGRGNAAALDEWAADLRNYGGLSAAETAALRGYVAHRAPALAARAAVVAAMRPLIGPAAAASDEFPEVAEVGRYELVRDEVRAALAELGAPTMGRGGCPVCLD